MSRFAQLEYLTFLHLNSSSDGSLPVLAEELAEELRYLELLCLDWHFWEVERKGETIELTRWSTRKVNFRIPEDFGCGDEEWLYRHALIG
jgi:hypothetical protein